ncbi:hypothetical protein IEU_03021 [Bacillus mycoides]|nr:hypothetical protein IEW_03021 [Bacillus mycoides]EJQ66557.1 hypothetical protein IEY_02313 [Bacillus mycoides]EJV66045.1 hypothetical protein IEU_03021 [Bacillus mycoides]
MIKSKIEINVKNLTHVHQLNKLIVPQNERMN